MSFFRHSTLALTMVGVLGGQAALAWQDDGPGQHYDLLIYGSTPAALSAAIQTVRMNHTVAIVTSETHIGGMTTSGLGWTDSKDGHTVGGIAREFYGRIYDYYLDDSLWTQQTRDSYDAHLVCQPGWTIEDEHRVQWTFEPHVAERVFEDWMKEMGIPIFRDEWLDLSQNEDGTWCGVELDGQTIKSIKTLKGNVYYGSVFMDAGYEGDLMAAAGVPWTVGRESREEFNETLAGALINNNSVYANIDPYVTPGDPSSGFIKGLGRVLPTEEAEKLNGTADPTRIQSYNYRVSLTKQEGIKREFFKPEGYDESEYELLFRYITDANYTGPFFTSQLMPNLKTDSNAQGSVSSDLLGGNYDASAGTNYATVGYEERKSIADKHKVYQQGFFWTLANHHRIPEDIRNDTGQWGWTNDEFKDNDNWPYEVYIREGRRMQGLYTMTQNDVETSQNFTETTGDSIVGLGSYSLDVHQVERVVIDGKIYNEGLINDPVKFAYSLPYNSLLPPRDCVDNFLNPVTVSATHMAFASIRMEPVYMILGQSAATAAMMALEDGVGVHDVDREKLTGRLRADGQVLYWADQINPRQEGAGI